MDPTNITGEDYFSKDLSYADDEKELLFYFQDEGSNNKTRNLAENNQSLKNSTNTYVNFKFESISCFIYDDFDEYFKYIIILIPILYFIIAFSLICYCIKLRRVTNQYHRLIDEKEGSQMETSKRPEQQIELGSSINAGEQ
jgi:hypothetical protein